MHTKIQKTFYTRVFTRKRARLFESPALDRCRSTCNSDKRRGDRPFDLHSEEVSVPMCETLVVLAATITKLLIQSPQLDQSPEYDDTTHGSNNAEATNR